MKRKLSTVALFCLVMSATIAQVKTDNALINKQTVKKMTAKEVVEAYSAALAKGDIPTAFSHFSPSRKMASTGK